MEQQSAKKPEKVVSSQLPKNVITRKRKIIATLLIIFWIIWIFVFQYSTTFIGLYNLPLIFSVTFCYLTYKLILSLYYNPKIADENEVTWQEIKSNPEHHHFTVSVIMPSFNERAYSIISALDSLTNQTYPIKEIIFVDDGSGDIETYHTVCKYIKLRENYNNLHHDHQNTKIIAHRFDENCGKRHAQAWGFNMATGDFLQLTDSDGTLLPNATEELVKAFASKKGHQIGSVVGYVGAKNAKKNFITSMQDMSYCAAFNVGRAAQSVTGNVVVCSGALSMHRREIVLENMDEFLNKYVLKVKVENGDDRRMTVISRKNGWKTKYQSTAVCYTNVPDTIRTFIRQRTRWTRSSYLCSIQNVITKPWKYPIYVIHSFLDAYLWLITLILWFIFSRDIDLTWEFLIDALIFYILICYANKVHYAFQNPIKYMLSPIYSVLYGILLLCTRIHAILVIFKYGWGTR